MRIFGYVLAVVFGLIGFRLLLTAIQGVARGRVLVRRGTSIGWEPAASPGEAWSSALRLGLFGILLLILSGAIAL
jgi:hypothetical protein